MRARWPRSSAPGRRSSGRVPCATSGLSAATSSRTRSAAWIAVVALDPHRVGVGPERLGHDADEIDRLAVLADKAAQRRVNSTPTPQRGRRGRGEAIRRLLPGFRCRLRLEHDRPPVLKTKPGAGGANDLRRHRSRQVTSPDPRCPPALSRTGTAEYSCRAAAGGRRGTAPRAAGGAARLAPGRTGHASATPLRLGSRPRWRDHCLPVNLHSPLEVSPDFRAAHSGVRPRGGPSG